MLSLWSSFVAKIDPVIASLKSKHYLPQKITTSTVLGLVALLVLVIGSVSASVLVSLNQENRQQARVEAPPSGGGNCLPTQRSSVDKQCGGKAQLTGGTGCVNDCGCGYSGGTCGNKPVDGSCVNDRQCQTGLVCVNQKCTDPAQNKPGQNPSAPPTAAPAPQMVKCYNAKANCAEVLKTPTQAESQCATNTEKIGSKTLFRSASDCLKIFNQENKPGATPPSRTTLQVNSVDTTKVCQNRQSGCVCTYVYFGGPEGRTQRTASYNLDYSQTCRFSATGDTGTGGTQSGSTSQTRYFYLRSSISSIIEPTKQNVANAKYGSGNGLGCLTQSTQTQLSQDAVVFSSLADCQQRLRVAIEQELRSAGLIDKVDITYTDVGVVGVSVSIPLGTKQNTQCTRKLCTCSDGPDKGQVKKNGEWCGIGCYSPSFAGGCSQATSVVASGLTCREKDPTYLNTREECVAAVVAQQADVTQRRAEAVANRNKLAFLLQVDSTPGDNQVAYRCREVSYVDIPGAGDVQYIDGGGSAAIRMPIKYAGPNRIPYVDAARFYYSSSDQCAADLRYVESVIASQRQVAVVQESATQQVIAERERAQDIVMAQQLADKNSNIQVGDLCGAAEGCTCTQGNDRIHVPIGTRCTKCHFAYGDVDKVRQACVQRGVAYAQTQKGGFSFWNEGACSCELAITPNIAENKEVPFTPETVITPPAADQPGVCRAYFPKGNCSNDSGYVAEGSCEYRGTNALHRCAPNGVWEVAAEGSGCGCIEPAKSSTELTQRQEREGTSQPLCGNLSVQECPSSYCHVSGGRCANKSLTVSDQAQQQAVAKLVTGVRNRVNGWLGRDRVAGPASASVPCLNGNYGRLIPTKGALANSEACKINSEQNGTQCVAGYHYVSRPRLGGILGRSESCVKDDPNQPPVQVNDQRTPQVGGCSPDRNSTAPTHFAPVSEVSTYQVCSRGNVNFYTCNDGYTMVKLKAGGTLTTQERIYDISELPQEEADQIFAVRGLNVNPYTFSCISSPQVTNATVNSEPATSVQNSSSQPIGGQPVDLNVQTEQ